MEEISIPTKRSRRGKRYGFARFLNDRDEKLLETKLDNVFLEGRKIFPNLPKFGRELNFRDRTGPMVMDVGKGAGSRKHGPIIMKSIRNRVSRNGVTCADVIKGEKYTKLMEFFTNKDESMRFSKAYIGEVLDSGTTYSMEERFYAEGFFTIKVVPLGANLCILEDVKENFLEQTMKDGSP